MASGCRLPCCCYLFWQSFNSLRASVIRVSSKSGHSWNSSSTRIQSKRHTGRTMEVAGGCFFKGYCIKMKLVSEIGFIWNWMNWFMFVFSFLDWIVRHLPLSCSVLCLCCSKSDQTHIPKQHHCPNLSGHPRGSLPPTIAMLPFFLSLL